MAPASEDDRLLSAWRALSGAETTEGWRTIPVCQAQAFRLLAGRHFPGNDEAILVGFEAIRLPPQNQLPTGRGFRVERLDKSSPGGGLAWLALARQPAGNLEIFAMMTGDIVGLLESCIGISADRLFQIFLGRIRAWQAFMESGRDGMLSDEAELGLFGELLILRKLIEAGIPAEAAVEAWQGPMDGIQDFRVGPGAIEVKTSLATGSFPATISSMEQLDDSLVSPLFLAAVRLALLPGGQTLPELAASLADELTVSPPAQGSFRNLLMQAGLHDIHAERYTRRFTRLDTRFFTVDSDFPRLVRSSLPTPISRVRYELDLDLLDIPACGLEGLLDGLEQR